VAFVVCTLAVKKKIRAGFDLSDRTIPLLEDHEKIYVYINLAMKYRKAASQFLLISYGYIEMLGGNSVESFSLTLFHLSK
jgi:hypothetical protein